MNIKILAIGTVFLRFQKILVMDFQSRETQTTPLLPENDSVELVENGLTRSTPATNSESEVLNEGDTESSPLTSSNEIESISSGMETESTPDLVRIKSESTPSLDEAQPLVPQSSLTFSSIDTTKTGISWPFSSWEDGKRRSAFLPYKPTTVLTNLQRGNIQAKPQDADSDDVSWFEKAGRGNISRLDIKNVEDINQVDSNGLTALMWSCAYGQTATVELLIEESANVHKRGHNLETALHLAAAGGHHDIIRVLFSNGADVNAEDKDGNSPLLYAVYGDHAHAVNELIENGCDLWEPNNFHVKAYNLAVEKNCTQARIVIEEYLKQLICKLL